MTTRLKGTGLRFLLGETDHWAQATSVVMEPQTLTSHYLGGGMGSHPITWQFIVTATQSTDEDSLWTFLWEHANTEAPFAYAPTPNEIPTLEQPHFTGIVHLPGPPILGGDADTTYVFTVHLPIIQGPLRVTEE